MERDSHNIFRQSFGNTRILPLVCHLHDPLYHLPCFAERRRCRFKICFFWNVSGVSEKGGYILPNLQGWWIDPSENWQWETCRTGLTHHFARQTFREKEQYMRSWWEHSNSRGTMIFNRFQNKIHKLIHSGKIKSFIFSSISLIIIFFLYKNLQIDEVKLLT